MTRVYKEPFDMSSIPTPVLLTEARKRRKEARKKGPWAIVMKFKTCPGCGREFNARQFRAHSRKRCLVIQAADAKKAARKQKKVA